MRSRLLSYLSDNGVRFKGTPLTPPDDAKHPYHRVVFCARWAVLERACSGTAAREQQHKYWRSLIAQEVLADPLLLSLVRLCGVKEVIAFALAHSLETSTALLGPQP
jgi:hypothetical protein